MQPINYSIGQVPNPQDSFLSGIQQGTALNAMQMQREQQAAQQQAAMAAQRRIQSVLGNPNASHDDLVSIIPLMDPKMSSEVLKAREAADKGKAQAAVSHGMQVVAALRSPSPEVGVQMLEDRATALENSGRPQDAARFRGIAAQAKANPSAAANMVGIGLAGLPGAKDAFESLGKLGEATRAEEQAPGALRKVNADAAAAEADAQTKAITAKYGEQSVLLDLQQKGWNIKALQANMEFQRESNRIAAMNAATNRERNSLEAQALALKVKDAQRALDEKVRDRVATAETGAAAIDNMLNTIERVKKNPSLNDVLGSIEGRLPSVFSDAGADAVAMIDTLGSQAFLAQIPNIKGMGQLSNAEGEKLQSALQNLSRTQSEGQFRANLDEAARLLKKGRENLSKSTGVPLAKPDTPAAPGARPPLASFGRGG